MRAQAPGVEREGPNNQWRERKTREEFNVQHVEMYRYDRCRCRCSIDNFIDTVALAVTSRWYEGRGIPI